MKKLLLIAAAASAAGCAPKFNGHEHALSVAEEHPISVDAQIVTMTLAGGSGGLSDLDSARLKAFADSYMRNGHGALSITTPSGGDGAAVREALYEAGVPHSAMSDAAYRAGEGSSRDVILSYSRYVATPSACGIWDGERDRNYRNMRTPNFGCAAQNNLAAMIGDPHDLVEPAAMTAPDSQTRIRGVTKYRRGEDTGSK
ncbi:MAG: CpaD family pilus assembly protein, partial [Parvularculaceae bacterium]|nr:CpaD family pilus assembly protein [Parvularculaceae bacterium]